MASSPSKRENPPRQLVLITPISFSVLRRAGQAPANDRLPTAYSLRQHKVEFGLPLELATEGAEAEFFYEAITRPAERLLLTRPRLADNGAPWQASP
jgi:hypothetical protein